MDETIILRAISFAARKHQGQLRKDRSTPYAAHPMRVLAILSQVFGVKDPGALAAAALHDVIEDTATDRDEIEEEFGPRVAAFVAELTKDKRLPEDQREDRYFDALGRAPLEVKLLKLGDALDNLIDAADQPAGARRKTVEKAKRLLALLEPRFPQEWAHALERVREQVRAAEKGS